MPEDLINEYKKVVEELKKITQGTEAFMLKLAEKDKIESELKKCGWKKQSPFTKIS